MDRVKLAVERLMRERRHLARNEENNFSVLDTRQIAQTLTGTTRILRLQILPRRAQWQQPLRAGLNATGPDAQTLATWWTTLNDADLSDLIERAAAGNLDLKIAQARVREARGRRGIARAGLFPFLDLGGSATVSRGSEDIGSGERRELYRTGFDASWEVDVFGGVRRSIEAAQGDLEANVADYRDVMVSLLAEVALNYVEARTLQMQLQVGEENLKSQAETLQLTEWRLAAGLVSVLDAEEARSNLESTRAALPRLRSSIAAAKNRLAVLLGVFPGALEAQLAARRPVPEPPLEIAVGVPAEVLRRRPDVQRAERQLAAQTARVGVATADLYPRFVLPGSIGLPGRGMDIYDRRSPVKSSPPTSFSSRAYVCVREAKLQLPRVNGPVPPHLYDWLASKSPACRVSSAFCLRPSHSALISHTSEIGTARTATPVVASQSAPNAV